MLARNLKMLIYLFSIDNELELCLCLKWCIYVHKFTLATNLVFWTSFPWPVCLSCSGTFWMLTWARPKRSLLTSVLYWPWLTQSWNASSQRELVFVWMAMLCLLTGTVSVLALDWIGQCWAVSSTNSLWTVKLTAHYMDIPINKVVSYSLACSRKFLTAKIFVEVGFIVFEKTFDKKLWYETV